MKNSAELTPRQIVEELDKYIVGQDKAKKAVAVALRNRYRRRLLSEDLRDEVIPKNILMIGPTGVGKTEIARRLATLAGAPFVKVEATKFTEVGYVGRDVDSMVRDLVQRSVSMIETEKIEEVRPLAEQRAIVAHIATATAKLDGLRTAAERTIVLLKERRAALIAAAVTGKIGVPTRPASGKTGAPYQN